MPADPSPAVARAPLTPERLRRLLAFEQVPLTVVGSSSEDRGDHVVETLSLVTGDGEAVRGILVRPAERSSPRPAILHAHAHGGRYDIGASELVDGRPALLATPGPVFARAGYIVLSIDMPTFGERAGTSESAAAKAALWYGRTLFGRMLGEAAGALSLLAGRPDVDAGRLAVTGISMGATTGYFLAAVDPRVSALAQLCCLADFATLVETGAHDLHGHYLTIPGLLAETTTGEIAGLAAPRPQLVCLGADDPLTPPLAIERAVADARRAYSAAGAEDALTVLVEDGVGHKETPTMHHAVLEFLNRTLKGLE